MSGEVGWDWESLLTSYVLHYPSNPDGFWGLTPRQLMLLFRAANERLAREHDERMSLAWHIAALPRSKKFPELTKLLTAPRYKRPKRQDWQTQAAILAAW